MPFENIIGHEKTIDILKRTLRRGGLPNAYLFSGPDGVGKRLTALTVAKAANCCHADSSGNQDSCGQCLSCRKIDSRNHPDITYVEAEGEYIKIEQIRLIQERINYPPLEGRWKFYIIDEADRLYPNAANCLLKVLEEPPSKTTFILVTSKPYSLFPTILSRCQKVPFGTIPEGLLLQRIMGMGIKMPDARFSIILSEGRLGMAIAMEKEDLKAKRDQVFIVLERLSTGDVKEFLSVSEELSSNEEALDTFLNWILLCLRDILILKASGNGDLILNCDRLDKIKLLTRELTVEDTLYLFDLLQKIRQALQRNVRPQVAMDVLMMEMSKLLQGING